MNELNISASAAAPVLMAILLLITLGYFASCWIARRARTRVPRSSSGVRREEMTHPDLIAKLDAIEAELRRLGYLTGEPKPVEGVTSAFGYGQVTFENWLAHVFLPNARAAVESGIFRPVVV